MRSRHKRLPYLRVCATSQNPPDSLEERMLIPSLRLSREDGMGKPYSMDLRERVVAAIEDGVSTRQAAARFAIGIATAGTWARLKRATGEVRPAKQGKPKGSVLD